MIILTVRTDKPEAEIGLFNNVEVMAYETWQAHRELAETIHKKIEVLLSGQGKSLKDIEGIVCFEGPGSFTGLRIGLSMANALAYSLQIPVVAAIGENWIKIGTDKLLNGKNEKIALPHYGEPAKTTQPKK